MEQQRQRVQELYTKEELIAQRKAILRNLKFYFKKETDPAKRAKNFNDFKMKCRDRVHDALGGHSQTKDGYFYWTRYESRV